MYIPGHIRIFDVLNSDGYSTGKAPPSGNNAWYSIQHCSTEQEYKVAIKLTKDMP